MSTRRPFAPPDPPPVPAVERLQVQRATRGVRERLRWFAAFTVCLLGAFGWAWLWGFALVPDGQLLLCLALPGFVALGLGLVYFGLPLADEVTRWVLFVAAARQEIALRADTVSTGLDAVEAHAARWYRLPRRHERVILHRTDRDSTSSPVQKARVSSPPENPPERVTQQLPALPAPTPYYGTDAYAICDAALLGQPTGVNTLGRRLGKARHAAAMARLVAAEVFVPGQGRGQGPALAPRFLVMQGDPALAHAEIARWLGAPLPSPTSIRDGQETAP